MAKSPIIRNDDDALERRLMLLKEVAAWLRERTKGRDHTPAEQLLREARDER
jgi:hypothetical protein